MAGQTYFTCNVKRLKNCSASYSFTYYKEALEVYDHESAHKRDLSSTPIKPCEVNTKQYQCTLVRGAWMLYKELGVLENLWQIQSTICWGQTSCQLRRVHPEKIAATGNHLCLNKPHVSGNKSANHWTCLYSALKATLFQIAAQHY
jgi:hypothetical protein